MAEAETSGGGEASSLSHAEDFMQRTLLFEFSTPCNLCRGAESTLHGVVEGASRLLEPFRT